jgi:hypothetical protein
LAGLAASPNNEQYGAESDTPGRHLIVESLISIQSLSLVLLLLGIGLAFSRIRLSGWVLGWILLSGALLLQGFRSMLSYFSEHGGLDATMYAVANDWMGLGFSLLVVA